MFELKKIGIVKRASAWLLDAILLAVLATGFMFLISLIAGFSHQQSLLRKYRDAWEAYRLEYLDDIADHYGFGYEVRNEEGTDYTITFKESGEEADFYDVIRAMEQDPPKEEDDPALVAAYKAYLKLVGMNEAGEYVDRENGVPAGKLDAQYQYVNSLLFTMLSVGLLLAYLVLEFIVPVILKNGQTVGKKIFSICLVRADCVKITTMALFARTVLGKFAIETMFPVLLVFLFLFSGLGWLAVALFGAFALLNIILFFATKNRTPIHDLLAGTVAADAKLQMIYASEEELAAQKALAQKEFIESPTSLRRK